MYDFITKEILSKIGNKTVRFIMAVFIVVYSAFVIVSNTDDALRPSEQSTDIEISSDKNFVTKKDIIMKTYPGCDIRSRSGRYISSAIEINAPIGFSITNYKEAPKGKDKHIAQRRSNLLNSTFNANKFTATCVGNGKVKRVLGIVVDHYNAWRYSNIILTLEKNKK